MKENTNIVVIDVTDNIKLIPIPDEVVEDVQNKGIAVALDEDIIAEAINMHETDKRDDRVLDKPILKAFQKDLISKQVIFERAKNDLYNKYIPKEFKTKKFNWELDYNTSSLFVEFVN